MTGNVVFLDTETTGLDPDRHSIWEVALIVPDPGGGTPDEHVWQFPVDEVTADPVALEIGRWWDRRWGVDPDLGPGYSVYGANDAKERSRCAVSPPHQQKWAEHFRDLVGTAHLCGAVVSFDEERLRRLLRSLGVAPRWHYHLIDVEALAVGCIAGREPCDPEVPMPAPPWDSSELSRAVGVDPDHFDRHTALGDARWAKAIYEAVLA